MAAGDNFGSVEETAWALIALSQHEDIADVSSLINSAIEYLKSNQSDNGGFEMMSCGDTPQYTAVVIQALIANGRDPLANEWTKENGNLVSSMLNDQMADGTFRACKMFGDYVDMPSTERAFAALADLYNGKSMYKEIDPVLADSDIVKNTIKELKDYYKNHDKYNYLQAMGLNISGMDVASISSKLEMRKEEADRTCIVWEDSTEMHAKDIMGIIAVGLDPRDYQGKNYVAMLEKTQKENGEFNIAGEDANKLSDQAYSIIALDMADAAYDVEKAVNVLVTKYNSESNPTIYTVAETIIALAKHKGINGAADTMNACMEALKNMQLESGGFGYKENSTSECSKYDSIAIQALVAAGKDPLAAEFQKNEKTVFDGIMAFKQDDHFVYDSQKSGYKEYTDEATGMVLAALVDLDNNESMYHFLAIEYAGGEEPETNEKKIKQAVDDLRAYYNNDDIFTFREAIAYRYTSAQVEDDLEIIQSKYKVKENPSQASDYAANIIGLIIAGKSPRDYNEKNYVQTLVKAQGESGIFQIKDEGVYLTQTVFSMIALDMADADYNRESAVKVLMDFQDKNGSFSDIDSTAMVIMALVKYKDMAGVKECIDKALEYIHAQQTDSGGFIAWGSENPYTAAAVIQGLIAAGEDPLSAKWTKNDKTILDSLLSFKVEDHFENKSEFGTDIKGITEQAFMALADLRMGKSMYHELAITYVEPQKVTKVEIQRPSTLVMKTNYTLNLTAKVFDDNNQEISTEGIMWESSDLNIAVVDQTGFVIAKKAGTVTVTVKVKGNENIKDMIELTVEAVPNKNFEIIRVGKEIFKNGSEAKLQVRVKNIADKNQQATLMVVLYDKDSNKMINYSYVIQNINAGESKDMIGGFLVPVNGNYEVRGCVWDNFEEQNIFLTTPIVVDVQD